MGIVFGKTGVLEPPFQVLLTRNYNSKIQTPYEIRHYGIRFACETEYSTTTSSSSSANDSMGFRTLAGYIGVGTSPQNTASRGIAMTAPVVSSSGGGGQAIAMTAPVVTSAVAKGGNAGPSTAKKMAFILPQEFDSLDKIPQPTNPNVHITQIPAAKGAVHAFNGSCSDAKAKSKARELVQQLKQDGVDIKEEEAMENFELWQFHPPFTIPMLRRNEVWIALSEEQVNDLLKKYKN